MNGFASSVPSPSPRRWARVCPSLLLFGALVAACSAAGELDPAAETPLSAVPAGAVRGEAVRYVFTMEDGGMDVQYFLRTGADLPEQRLFFTDQPVLDGGTLIDVWGQADAEGIRVQRMAVVPVAKRESTAHALIGDKPLRTRKFAFVLVDLGAGVRLTKADAERKLFGTGATDGSVRQYFIEASYGKQDISGEVVGPIKATMAGCNFQALATSLRGSVPQGFDHYLWYFGSRVASCPFAGVAVSGRPSQPTRDTWYNAASDCVVLVQEPAHNFGAMHSSAMKCRNGLPFADAPGTGGACVHNEYGDPYDPMGRGCRHMNGYQKAFQGWFGGCNVVDVNTSGTFTLLPLETPCNGPQLLQIKMPKARPFAHSGGGGGSGVTDITHYYLEYRTAVGFDKGLTPVVQVRVSGDIRQLTQRGVNSWLLDMNPATPVIEGMIAGGTFTDPAGSIKFTVMGLDPKQATVKVEITGGTGAGPTCLDGKPLPTPAPGPESCAANVATIGNVPPPAVDGGTPTTPPAGSGGAGGSSPGAMGGAPGASPDGALIPVSYDAAINEGFKDAGAATPSGVEPIGTPVGGGAGSGSKGSGGSSGGAPTSNSGDVASGGCACRVSDGHQQANGSVSALAGLMLFGLWVVRRRRPRVNS
jgi:MYXO-CTERM domain-containing protein